MIRIGPAGWTLPGLDAVWPARRGPDFDPLEFLGRYFGCVEVDITAHAMPRPEHVRRWSASLADHPRARLIVRVPRSLVDLTRPATERAEDAARFVEALASLARRQRLGAVVATLDERTLFGPAEMRALVDLALVLESLDLVLEAPHRSWYEDRALDALAGASWSLAHLETDDRWDAPPALHRPTGPVGMLRLVRPGAYEPPRIGALARRARRISQDVDAVYVVADNAGRAGTAAGAGLAAALEMKYVLTGERPVPAWPRIVEAFPHLAPLVVADDAPSERPKANDSP